ncbi:hypothetical protein J2S78_002743 [Salibacterium salarium]|uniref:hypothetical protein n=1 Tax=Salibacterium salarium TaxID=284579 RepID=UPI00277EAFAA|nr:hypothetical protein [Salibacterium salarium]MDQ0300296.1 hypothetical protein [Salibacterium salarium]
MKIIRGMTIRRVSLIYLSYDNTRSLNMGNKVEVQINGGIDQTHLLKLKQEGFILFQKSVK